MLPDLSPSSATDSVAEPDALAALRREHEALRDEAAALRRERDVLVRENDGLRAARITADEAGRAQPHPEDEAAAHAAEARFRTLAGALPQIVWTSGADDRTDYLNERWTEFTGLPAEHATPEQRVALIHPDDRDRALAVRSEGAARGEPYEAEFRLRRHDGVYRWVLGRAVPVRDDEGRMFRWFGTFTDIEDRRRTDERRAFLLDLSADLGRLAEPDVLVREGVERLRAWLGAASCTLFLVEAEGDAFVLAPQVSAGGAAAPLRVPAAAFATEFERLAAGEPLVGPDTATEPDAARAAAFARAGTGAYLTAPVVRAGVLVAVLSLRERGRRAWTPAEVELTRRVAELVWPAYENALLLQGLEAERDRLGALARTLEARVDERTARLAAQGTELEARNRDLHEFAQAAGHDLRAPLRTIRSFADLLAADYGARLDGEGQAFLDRLRAAAGRMDRLLTDLLAYARVTTHARPFEPVRLREVAENVVADLAAALAESGGAVRVGALPSLEADPSQMHQLLQNLVGNALKFHHAGSPPVVHIDGDADGERVRLTVRDEGIGFDERHAERIFAPFHRLHGQATYEGIGVGLAICRRIAERHGGTITAQSRQGEGATFVVTLPVRQGA